MKKIILFIALVLGAVFYPSCSNDIDLISEWKDIPIVYALISESDTANYIRVEKAFLDNDKSALDIAQIPDSLYYENITVQIVNQNTSTAHTFNRVDGNLEGFPRKEGIFANAPNYLYKLKLPTGQSLEAGAVYELQINRGDDLPLVTAQTTMVSPLEIRVPSTNPMNADPIRWMTAGLRVEFKGKHDGHIFDTWVYLHIEEEDINDPSNVKTVTLDWKIMENEVQNISGNSVRMEARLTKQDLFNYLHNNLEANPNIIRRFKSLDILVIGGGEELLEYIETGNANTGITSTQVIPTYTNISEGRGIFSSKNHDFHEGYTVNAVTIDSLQNNGLTQDLNFQF